ncbi:hypothetical protein DYY66_2474 [Candidatus Nitrosotalea sp. FS]|uniref:matrixin family metalloprotease n=1 Tax=Candidatus Nitrosotalea sp. FS TaxID=2341021 RepID=UPI00140C712E|nr:matrixin family metalloprotease [Candidatus Nitrosotalea sp. FS]NHH98182.1 hypothetical protein [Candidatus Nitrosotalea sp. FS]
MNVELVQDLEQQKIILKEINSILRRQNQAIQNKIVSNQPHGLKIENKKIIHVTIAIIAVSTLSLFVVYLQYENQFLTPKLSGATSSYVIQNLQGDTVNTWVAWNIANDRVIHIHVVNDAKLSQNMLDSMESAITSTKAVNIDNSQTGKGPKGTSSIFYVGWEGAAEQASSEHTKSYIPQKFDINGSPDGTGDVEIILTTDVSPDGYSGYTKSLVDGNEILKSKITIYKADKLDANNLSAIIRHEFGHAMGLGHSTASEDLMSPVLPDYPYISGCDIDALKGLYDGNKNSKVICIT